MPKRMWKKKQWKRKPRRVARKTINVNRSLQPIAQRYVCRLKYSDVFQIASPSFQYQFNLNSIFDPNRSGVGFQPYGHDTLATLYNRYRVVKTDYVLTAYNATTGVRLAAIPANEVMSVNSLSDAITNPRAKFIVQYPGGNTNKLKGSIHIPSLMGRNKSQYMADDRFQATFGTSPAELAILNIYGGGLNDAGQAIDCTITMTFTIECFDIKQLAQS